MSPNVRHRRAGFALLITVTLLAFLVLLLVSLASLTRVETQVASNTRQLTGARQNALMALNVALGQLQRHAGPDRRVTGPSDAGSAATAPGRSDAQPRWTGVWRHSPPSGATPAQEAYSPELLTWLVSGNEDGLTVNPSDALADPTGAAGSPTVWLVNGGTADFSGTPSAANPDTRVKVPRRELRSSSMPGQPGDSIVGHYAWWVGDEGVKAKVSLRDPWSEPAATAEQQSYRLRVAQRTGIELIEPAYPANADKLPSVLSLGQLPLVPSSDQAALASVVKNRFHDLTASSWSVLADAAQGGLKKDLTAWLAHATPAAGAPVDSDFIAPLDAGDTTGFSMPRWGLLRSYAGLAGGATPLPPRPRTDTDHGFHPVISYFRIAFALSALPPEPLPPPAPPPDPAAPQPLVAHLFPTLALWNPYDTPIAAADYEFVFGIESGDGVSWGPSSAIKARLALSGTVRLMRPTDGWPGGGQLGRTYTRLLVRSPVIQPGQSLVFTLDDSGEYRLPGDMNAIALSANNPPRFDNSFRFTHPDIFLTQAERNAGTLRIVIPGGQLDMALYPRYPDGGNPTLNPTVADWRALAPYHLVQYFGLAGRTSNGSSGAPHATLALHPDDAEPGARYWHSLPGATGLNTNHYYVHPRWLANGTPRAPLHLLIKNVVGGGYLTRQTFLNDSTLVPAAIDSTDGNTLSTVQLSSSRIDSPSAAPLVMAELPVSSLAPEARFFSLAQLQHANLSKLSYDPAYAVGNSLAHFHVAHTTSAAIDLSLTARSITAPSGAGNNYVPNTQVNRLYDLSHALNRALWDRYYFSTAPAALTDAQVADAAFHLPNARHVFHHAGAGAPAAAPFTDPEAFHTAASALLVNGGFNINSTSEHAWRALLAAHNGLDSRAGTPAPRHPFSRFARTRAGDLANDAWASGYRILTDDQIQELASRIVAEVRARGPFLSLADFVNRRLANDATGYKGALQAAIDATDTASASARVNGIVPFTDPAYRINIDGNGSYMGRPLPGTAGTATTAQKKLQLSTDEDPDLVRFQPSGSRAAFMPGFLTQADLLNSLGPVLAARSDTFRIRCYGDVQSPATGEIEGAAWCEAIVQRLPEYVDDTVDSWALPPAGSPGERFGRRFKVMSFRWLSPSDI